ncbi:MAG: hypothetical protein PHP64_07405 [Actinomycetota bacterium]|nr:hypothetical protein [Actinomycetota bacterium]
MRGVSTTIVGEVETRIKELRYDFGADGFCLNSFYGKEAALSHCLPVQSHYHVLKPSWAM